MKINNLKTLDELIEEQYGKRGASKREKFEKGYQKFKKVALKTKLTSVKNKS